MKKAIIVILVIFLALIGTFAAKYILLKKSKEIPYCNLTNFSTGFYFIYCDISYDGKRHTIVPGNTPLHSLFLREKGKIFAFSPIYSLMVNETIRHNWAIRVNEQMYHELRRDIVKKELVNEYEKLNIKDFIIASKGKIPDSIDYNAAIYILLKNGINCYNYCESGGVGVILPTSH